MTLSSSQREQENVQHVCIDVSCLKDFAKWAHCFLFIPNMGKMYFCKNLGFKQFKRHENDWHHTCPSCTNINNKETVQVKWRNKILSKRFTVQILQGLFHDAAFNSIWRTKLFWTVCSYKQGTVVVIWLLVVSITHYSCYTLQSVIKLVLCI